MLHCNEASGWGVVFGSIALQPLSVQGYCGANLAAGVTEVSLAQAK